MMTLIRSCGAAVVLCIARCLVALLLAFSLASAQTPAADPNATMLERIKAALDQVEATLKSDSIGSQTLADLRTTIVATREELRGKIAEWEPRAAEIGARLKQLGKPPEKDAPPEDAAVTTEREQLTQTFGQTDGLLKQAKQLALRTEQLSERISEKRRALYARQVLERGPSILDPSFWSDTFAAIPGEIASSNRLLSSWAAHVVEAGAVNFIAALLLIALVIAAIIMVSRWWLPRFNLAARQDTRMHRARTSLVVFFWLSARTPIAVVAALLILEAFGLLPGRMFELAGGIAVAIAVASLGRGVARGLLAPERPERRLIALGDHTARCFHDHIVWGTRLLGFAIVLQVVHKVMYSPITLSVATNMLFAFGLAALLLHLIRCLRREDSIDECAEDTPGRAPTARLLAWVFAFAIVAALLLGYAACAAFIALRVIVAVVILGALYLFIAVTDALFSEALAPDTPRSRAIAANLGITPRNVGLVGTLLSAGIRVLLIVLALIVIIGPWELSTADLTESMQSIPPDIRIGEISVSFRSILAALVVLAVVLLVTRFAQRWLTRELLPRTSIEPSLQLSIATMFGYAGAILAIALSLGSLGIDLQKIAFIASALAVGIGFGLQSIVSNFVSGLILLAERPIRVGDAIVVKGEQGWVRRIRVRATEIETYDRASVIIPNSELITGMVKNWTHANTMGRITIKVTASYDADPQQVIDILLEIAKAHPFVVQSPAPGAFFSAFGDSALEFEMFCVVGNVSHGGGAKSDIQIAILKKFREAGIAIPYPQRDIRIQSGGQATPAAPSPPASPTS